MRDSSSHRRTPHATPRRAAAVALVGVAALIAAAVQSGAATAAPEKAPSAAGKVIPGAESVKLSPAQRAELIRAANATKADTAKDLGLGAKEKLVVRDVVKDGNGTVHTRYERTYAGLPVLGGDLVVETAKSGATKAVVKATRAAIKPATTTAAVPAAKAEKQALAAAKAEDAKSPDVNRAPRKVIWAAQRQARPSPTRRSSAASRRTAPRTSCTSSPTPPPARSSTSTRAIETGTGNTMYSGSVTLGTTQSGSTYNLTDGARGNHKTYNLNRGTSGTGTLFSRPRRRLGQRQPVQPGDGGRRRALRCRADVGLLQERARAQRHPR